MSLGKLFQRTFLPFIYFIAKTNEEFSTQKVTMLFRLEFANRNLIMPLGAGRHAQHAACQ